MEKNTNFYAPVQTYTSFPIHNWYMSKYNSMPNLFYSNGHVKIDSFLEKYKDKKLHYSASANRESFEGRLSTIIIDLDSQGTIAYIDGYHFDKKQNFHKAAITVFYLKSTPVLQTVKKYIFKNRIQEEKKGIINLICKTQTGFSLKEYQIESPGIDFEINYNDDFKDIDSIILNRLNEENGKGLALLYGKPGTGKTSYIRHLINHIDKRVLYMPPDMASELSNPGLIPFLSDIPNSILVVEDAENVLIKRQGQHNQAISNILNLSDGLLSDCLKIQILATFNTDLSNIDDALLRKGRLIAKYEFKELTQDRINKLSKKLGIKFHGNSATLAEIYNYSEMEFSKTSRSEIGFQINEKPVLNRKKNSKLSLSKNTLKDLEHLHGLTEEQIIKDVNGIK